MAGRHVCRALLPGWLLFAAACSGPTPDQLLADARAAFAAGEIRTAEIHVKNLLQRRPDDVAGRVLLGNVALALGDAAAAEQDLKRAVALGADPKDVALPLARALVAERKYDEALAELARGPAREGKELVASLSIQALAHRGLGARESAEADYRAALRVDPKSAELRTDLAATLLEAGRTNDARTIIEDVLTEQPQHVPALLLRGGLESSKGQPAAAAATFQQVVDLERAKGARSVSYQLGLAQLVEAQLAQGEIDAAAANADVLLAANPQSPAARYVKAAVEVRQSDLGGAERRLVSLIAEVADYWPAYRLLGAIKVQQNQPSQAVMYLRNAVNNNPTDTSARLELAELYIRQGDVDAAKELMAATASTPVSDSLFFAFAGRASQQAGLEEQAAQYFARSEQDVPDDVRQLASVSSLYMQAGEFERATRVLRSASFEDDRSNRLKDYLLALVQIRQGNLQAADATAQALVAAEPAAAWPLNLRGTIALLGGDLPRAARLLDEALELEPQNVAALLTSARVAAAQNDGARTEKQLLRVTQVDAANAPALVGLAQLAAARRDFTASSSWIERLPSSPLRMRLTADLEAAQGKFDEAASGYSRAYDSQPSVELALRAYEAGVRAAQPNPEAKLLAWSGGHPQDPASNFALGSVALAKGEQQDAIARYEAVIATTPTHAAALNNLAWLYSQRGDQRALEVAERARAADPNNPAIADTLGWLQVQSGAAATGLPLLEKAVAGLPDQAEVRYHWAVALAETGSSAKAVEALEAALASNASFAGREDAERRLATLRGRP